MRDSYVCYLTLSHFRFYLISDAKYVIIQIQEKYYTEFRNKDQIKSCCTLKKPLRLCKVVSTLVNCVNRKPIEVMFVPQVTAL